MPVSFLSLPAELRNEIYTYLLICREPINPCHGGHELHPNILFTNTAILHEARALLYGHNCFDLTGESGHVSKFLDTIGSINASHLQCIRIDFPSLGNLEDEVSLEEGSLHILEKIQLQCTNIRKLITDSESTNTMEVRLHLFDSPTIRARALALTAARFGAISSLQEIIVEVYEENLSSNIRREMESHGWILKVVEPVEVKDWDVDRSWGDYEDDDYPSDDYDDDDYDIDNDSDFWRRAAD
ncbi:hypothetical protein ASPBRDRAFT_201504 [Aspergillus brasiliensis CBS 101740]|uniref:Uncharacterized protein n=1 Tax=Aspergillus brasiliensis (strain CBS 101740 / IMI 381727 / IBT 21946) TaxID=767769 RepID=A0A1L9U2C7_ASPBC|nr:hypothetical protein ASPBRDRAFT_201504 [Aspergillus brasiliensis CBS 101740]